MKRKEEESNTLRLQNGGSVIVMDVMAKGTTVPFRPSPEKARATGHHVFITVTFIPHGPERTVNSACSIAGLMPLP